MRDSASLSSGTDARQLTARSRRRLIRPMGVCDPPRGDMPKYRVPFLLRGRSHVILHHDISRQAFTTDRHGAHACPDRRSHRRGFRRRPAADSRRHQAQPSGCRRLERQIFRQLSHRRLHARAQSSRRARPPGCGMPMLPPETLEGGFEGWKEAKLPLVNASKLPPRDAQGPHRLGDPGAAEDRSHRLPVADPPLRRSDRGVSVRGAVRGCRRRRALQRRALRYRKRVLEPPRRTLHLRRHDRGIRPRDAALAAAGDDGARRRHRAARSVAGSARAARRLARPVADVRRRSRAARGRHDAVRRVLSLVPRRHRARRTTGPPTRRSRNGCHDGQDDRGRRA